MERKPLSTGSIVGAVELLIVVLLGLYVGGYFALSKYRLIEPPVDFITRDFSYDWQANIYRPLMGLEATVTGKEVWIRGATTGYTSDGVIWHKIGSGRWVEE